jgi:hypothetical protein
MLYWLNHPGSNGYIIIRLLLNILALYILVFQVYFRNQKRTEMYFTFLSFNTVIFFLSLILQTASLTAGAGFGLFAIFSLLRYRTEGMSAVDMTYLFLSIAIGLICAVAQISFPYLAGIIAAILFLTAIFESRWLYKKETSQLIQYDKITLIKESLRNELIADLKERTGLDITRVEIFETDFIKDSCKIKVYYNV